MATTSPSKRHLGLTSSTLISTSDVTVGGNLIVNGTTTTLNTATLQVEDKNIELNKGGSAASSNLGGITVLRGTSASAQFIWDQGNTRWDISNGLHVDGEIFTKSHGKSSQWATAYGWGDHADGGYAASGHNHDDDYLGKTAKAADSQKLDGLDSTKFLRDNGWNTHPGQDADLQPDQSVDFTYANNAPHSGPLVRIGANNYSLQLNSTYNNDAGGLSYRSYNADSAQKWNPWRTIYHSGVFTNNSGNWNTAYGWGDHADGGYLTAEADTLDTVADRGASTNQTIKSTNGLGFKVDSSGSARIEIENGGSNWAYLRLRDDTTVSWDIASYNGGNLEWRPGGSETKRMTYSSGGVLSVGDGFTSTKGNTAHGWGNHADAGYIKSFDITAQTDSKYLRSNAADTIGSTLTMGTQVALVANNYGRGVFGLYSATRYQHVWSMGAAYKTKDDGTTLGNLYGLAWTHSNNTQGEDIAGLGHQLLCVSNGDTRSAMGDGFWTKFNITTTSYGTAANWKTAYDWGDHANAGYIKTLPSHSHDDRYYTEDESDKLFADIDVESHINTAYVDIQVDGNADTYYPVRIQGRGSYAYQRYSVSRRYSWKAPDTWYTASHKGGLTFTFEWSGDTAWGGNHKAIRVVEFAESYSNMLGGIVLPVTGGIMVWLRGGGAQYRLHTPEGRNAGADIEYEAYEAGNGTVYRPRNAEEAATGRTNEVNPKWPVRNSNDLYDDGNRVATQSWSNSQYLGKTAKAADSDLLDGLDLHTGRNNEANKVVRTDANGYIQAGWINTTSGNNNTTAINRIYASQDGYIRYYTPANFISVLGLVTTTGYNNSNWNTAHGWGNHADAGYLTSFDITDQTDSKYLRSNANDTFSGSLVSSNRANGIFGTYDSTKTDSIWSMGTSYKNAADGSDFGSLYGLAYKHTNNSTGGTMAGSHQMVWCHNGSPKSAMGSGLWTSGTVTASGGNSGNWNTAHGWGNHADAGYLTSLPGHNHAGTHPLIDTATERGPDFDKLMPSQNHTTYKEVHAINEGLNIPSGYTYGVVKSQYMGSMKYQEYVPHTASRGSNATQDTIWFRTNWGGNNWYAWRYHIHSGNIGSQSVDNAIKLNGIDSGSFLRSDANDSASGSYSFTNSYNEFGNSTGSVSNDGGWNGRVNVAGSSHARLDVKSVSDGIITTMYAHTGHGAGKIGTMSSHPIQFMTGGTTRGQVNSKGVLHMASDIVGFWDFSDRRLKTNIKPLENNLEKVMSLHPVSYQWKEGDRKGRTDIGLIAQEVQEIVPEVVREQERLEEGSTKTYKTVDYEHLVSVLIGAVKEQQEQINELKSKMCKCNGK